MKYENGIMFTFLFIIILIFSVVVIQSYELQNKDLMLKEVNNQRLYLLNENTHLQAKLSFIENNKTINNDWGYDVLTPLPINNTYRATIK
jgi:hypothetical protein